MVPPTPASPAPPPPPIRLGTMVKGDADPAAQIRALLPDGFESFQIFFKRDLGGRGADELKAMADAVREALGSSGAVVSALACYGNPLAEDEAGAANRAALEALIDAAPAFGTDLVCGFTGRVPGASIPDSMPRFAGVFAPLADRAGERGGRIAFENCPMGGTWQAGDWNCAHHPAAWELMFAAAPAANLGLEWEPCHQQCQLIEPMPQIKAWAPRLFHLHGKDAELRPEVLRATGINGPAFFARHRIPGLGDANWAQILSELEEIGYRGTIDIEGWHDPVFKGERELDGQRFALAHLKAARVSTGGGGGGGSGARIAD